MIYNICIFGDSVAKGVVFDETKNRYACLRECFPQLMCQNQQITLANYAKFGCTLQKGETLVEMHKNEFSHYDCILLEFGGNDCDYNWAEIAAAPMAPHRCNTPIDQFGPRYGSMIENIRKAGGRPVMLNLPPIHPDRYFDWTSKGLNRENILQFLGRKEAIFNWHSAYNAIVEQIAKLFCVPLIDIRSAFLSGSDYGRFLCADGIHPNRDGHRLISEALENLAAFF